MLSAKMCFSKGKFLTGKWERPRTKLRTGWCMWVNWNNCWGTEWNLTQTCQKPQHNQLPHVIKKKMSFYGKLVDFQCLYPVKYDSFSQWLQLISWNLPTFSSKTESTKSLQKLLANPNYHLKTQRAVKSKL